MVLPNYIKELISVKILEYDEVDPMEVLQLNLMGLDYALTPELVQMIRQQDKRSFPFFALYGVVDGVIAGQVGVFRLPMVSTEGPEDVGGVWAVCTDPSFKCQGIASRLLNEAHERMRTEGLRFSTLGTSSYRVAHLLYRKQGYQDVVFSSSMLFHRNILIKNKTNLNAKQGSNHLYQADDLFQQVSENRLGFARRFKPFIPAMVAIGEIAMGELAGKDFWIIWEEKNPVGYLIAKQSGSVLRIVDFLLMKGINAIDAVTSLVRELPTPYIQIKSSHPAITENLSKLGVKIIPQDWSTFMMKPLTTDVTKIDPKNLFGIGTDRFLFSWMDTT